MSCLVQSVNLDPFELVWGEIDCKVRTKQPTSTNHLSQLLQENWEKLSSVYFQSLVKIMVKIFEAVRVSKEDRFDESKVFSIFFFFLV